MSTSTLRPLGRVVAAALLTVVALTATSGVARAGETDTFRLEPSPLVVQGHERRTFSYDLAPGSTITDGVRLTNLTDEVRRFRVLGADASEDPDSGSVSVAAAGVEPRGVGTWISVTEPEVTLLPHSATTIPFHVTRPRGTHARGTGAVVAEEVRDRPSQGGIDIAFRLAIVVRVDGDAAALQVTDPGLDLPLRLVPSTADAHVTLGNETLDDVDARVELTVESLTGRTWTLEPVDVRLAPGEVRTVERPWDTVPRWGGVLRVRAAVTWEAGTVATDGPRALYPPLWLLALVIAVVGIRAARELAARRDPPRPTDGSSDRTDTVRPERSGRELVRTGD